ncbi:hypothetical protein [uncultured Arthrobacter sp.]|uniref:hypothetical protein n=1 Tax=uncultured Arthrobacter sp. TaxID=114050 RepID=UPI002605476D|nr:hypothetical protein [uncultured Arthrobacter sp.]
MTPPAAGPEWDDPPTEGAPRPAASGTARELQARINSMQASTLASRCMPTVPALARILPGGGLQSGSSYAVRNSATLAMALLAGPSATGAWCCVIGVPDFSAEAAQGFGINLERLILIPDPGSQWLSVTAALVDVVSIVLVRTPEHLAPTEWARLKARLRQRGAALITLGSWKQSDSTLGVAESAWEGLGAGSGHLRKRRMKITATQPSGRLRHAYVGLAELQGTADGTVLPGAPSLGDGDPAGSLFEPRLMKSS